MKILWLYSYNKINAYNSHLHVDFFRTLGKQEGTEVMGYGYRLEEGYPDLAPITFNPNKTLENIKKEFDFDLIIVNGRSRMFYNILINKSSWLPKDFNKCKIPKIMIAIDFHYETEKQCSWYSELGIDLILQRHLINMYKGEQRTNIKNMWFPFSVNTDIFKPDFNIKRNKKIGFVGSEFLVYIHRKKAINILQDNKLIEVSKGKMIGNDYIKNLQSYISHLSGSSSYDITPGKMFEIMASGSLLFTNESEKYGLRDLFPMDSFCTYKEDCSDIIEKANMIITNPNYIKQTTSKALKCVRERHSHEIRAKELIQIIENELGVSK